MADRKPLAFALGLSLVAFSSLFIYGADPTVTILEFSNLVEQGFVRIQARATDPDGDALNYSWTIKSDPTGHAFLGSYPATAVPEVNGSTVQLSLSGGPNFPSPSFEGQTIILLLKVSDGATTIETDVRVPVAGVNNPPILKFDTSQMGTPQKPRLTGEGFGVNARESYDPDGSAVKFLWLISKILGGGPCDGGVVLFGKETETPGMPVPRMRATPTQPATIVLEYIVEDGLNVLRGTLSGYLASEGGCNTPPTVDAFATPNPAAYGQTVTLNGSASDPGDTMSYSWIQLGGTTSGIAIANANQKVASFTAPNKTTVLDFRFTATDSKGSKSSKDVSVEILESTGGGNAGGGGQETLVCSEGGNQPATATVPSRVAAISGKRVSIAATNGKDPDNTTVFVNGTLLSGVSYEWSVLSGAGILTSADLEGAHTSQVSFDTPQLSQDTSLLLNVLVSDPSSCGTRYSVEVALQASLEPNQPPVAKLSYQIESQGPAPAGAAEIHVQSPAVIILDASGSTDEGPLQFDFSLSKDLTSGSAATSLLGPGKSTLTITDGTIGTVVAKVVVTDDKGLTDSAQLTFVAEAPSEPPQAVLRYRKQGEEDFITSDGSLLVVASPTTLEIDASQSIDDGEISASFLLQQNLLFGSATLKNNGDKSRLLELKTGTQGRVKVLVTVIDGQGQNDSAELEIEVSDSRSVPVPVVEAFVGELPFQDGQRVAQDTVVTLDATNSHLENGEAPGNMVFNWQQTGGDPVNLMFSHGGRIARFRAPEPEGELSNLRFELTIEYIGLKSEPEIVEIPVELSPIVYGQVAFGPYGRLLFRTVFVFVNPNREDLQYQIEFLDDSGNPMDVMIDGEVWDNQSEHSLAGRDTLRLRFSGGDPELATIGWARVTSTRPLRGLVLYQLIDSETGELDSEVSLFSSPIGSHLSSFFDRGYGLAVAVVNPGQEEARVRIQLIDPRYGPDLPVASRPLVLEPGQKFSTYLDENFFSQLPDDFEVGTLLIEAIQGKVSAIVLKTNRQGVAISSMPIIEERTRVTPDSN